MTGLADDQHLGQQWLAGAVEHLEQNGQLGREYRAPNPVVAVFCRQEVD